MKILWSSNAPWSFSGYGTFTKDLAVRLRDDGWNLELIAFYGLQGHPITFEGMKVYPVMNDAFGSDALVAHGADSKAHVIFTMEDVWGLNPQDLQKISKWIPYVPVDKSPAPKNVTANLNLAYRILTFSKYGQKELEKSNLTSRLIVEGTDTNIFKPLNKKAELRRKLNIPENCFLFSMIGANKENPPRKGFQGAMEAFKLFSEKHKEAKILFSSQQPGPAGFPIQAFAQELGIVDKCLFTEPYQTIYKYTSEDINEYYNATDVLLHPSSTEGFGLCLIEAQSAGIPVIIQKDHSMVELIQEGKTGWGAETKYKWFTPDLSYMNLVDPESLNVAMEKAYMAVKTNPEKVAKDCRSWVVENYNIDTLVKEQWIPMLIELQEEIMPLPPTPE